MNQSKTKEDVWKTIQALNHLWTVENKANELVNYFHKDMVAISPTDRLRIEGQEACVSAWKSFTQHAKINYWKEIAPNIEIFAEDKFAVVTYYYEMSFDMSGRTIKTGGRDMFSLVKENGRWWVVANQFSNYPQ